MNVLERVINNLNILEFQDLTTVFDVVTAIQRTEMVMRIVEEIKRYKALMEDGTISSQEFDAKKKQLLRI